MLDNQIGLHVYRVTQHKTRKPATVPFAVSGVGAQLRSLMPGFISQYTDPMDLESGLARPWYFVPTTDDGFSMHGVIQYGSSGYEGKLVDSRTRAHQYDRKVTDMEVIPLYYRFWIPESGPFGLLAFQTFGLRSWVNRIREQLEAAYRSKYDGFRIVFTPVMPNELGTFKNALVKTITLVKREVSSDRALNQLGIPPVLVDYDVSVTARKSQNFGTVGSLVDIFRSKSGEKGIESAGDTFEEATSIVRIGRRNRKVTLLGVGRETGKIDLSDDVQRLPGGHPRLESISSEVKAILADVVTGGQNGKD